VKYVHRTTEYYWECDIQSVIHVIFFRAEITLSPLQEGIT
jgi:hypothetical protein